MCVILQQWLKSPLKKLISKEKKLSGNTKIIMKIKYKFFVIRIKRTPVLTTDK